MHAFNYHRPSNVNDAAAATSPSRITLNQLPCPPSLPWRKRLNKIGD